MASPFRIFISYARSDGEAFATALRERLEREEPELTLWQDRARMEGGRDWWQQITAALDVVQFMVLVMTPAALKSAVVRKEWQYARQRGVCVYPVIGAADLDFAALPRWMSQAHFYNLDKEWQTFVNYLKSPCQALRLPFMAPDPPALWVERTAVLTQLLDAVLDSPRQNSLPGTVALYGAGGFGKTTLATALCHDDRVITAFASGVLWVTLGEKPNLLGELTKLYAALTGERPGFVDEQDAALHLAEKLAEYNALLVIDDVWNEAHLRPFLRGGEGCTRLVTTRKFEIAATLARRVAVDEMQPAEAVRLLTARLDPLPRDLGPFYALARRLGEWPLLLELSGATLHQRLLRGETLERTLAHVNQALDRRGAVAFDRHDAAARNQAIARSMAVSLDELSAEERQRYTELAIFPDDVAIPQTAVAALWHWDSFDTDTLLTRLSDLSLLKYDLPTATLRLHDMIRHYLASQLGDLAPLHARLLDGWGDLYHLPDPYAWRWVGYHLVATGRAAQLRQLLLDYAWLEAKLNATDTNALVADCERLAGDPVVQRLGRTLRRAAYILAQDPQQLVCQLLGRLLDDPAPSVQRMLQQATASQQTSFLRPLTASLRTSEALIWTLQGHTDQVSDVAVTPDGCHAISASWDKTLRVWDLASGEEVRTLQGHTNVVWSVAVTPDGHYAVSASSDWTLKVWEIATGREIRSLRGHTDSVMGVAVTPDGHYVISASYDKTLIIWELTTGRQVRTFYSHFSPVFDVAVTLDGHHAVSASNGLLIVWALATGLKVHKLYGRHGKVVVMPDGRHVIFCSNNGTIIVWELETGNTVRTLEGHTEVISGLAVTPDGHYVISASWDKTLKVWDLASGQKVHTLQDYTSMINAVAVTPDGHYAISACWDKTLKVWDLALDQQMLILNDNTKYGYNDNVYGVTVTPDGRYVIFTSGYILKVWDLMSHQEVGTLSDHTGQVWRVAVVPDGRHVIATSSDKTLKIWDLVTGQKVHTLEGHTDLVSGVAVTPDGRHVISTSWDQTLKIWELATGQEMRTLHGHTDKVWRVVVTPDGHYAVSASWDKTLRVWELETGQEVRTLLGHTSAVTSVAVTPDGRHVISTSGDQTLKIWELASGEEVCTLHGHTRGIADVAVIGDGRLVVSVSHDNTLKVWEIHTERLLTTFWASEELYSCAVAPDGVTIVVAGASGRLHFLRLENV